MAQGSDPELIIGQHDFNMCAGDTLQIQIQIIGVAPVTVKYVFESAEFIVNSNSNNIELTTDEPGIYVITGFKDFLSEMIDTLDTIRVVQYPAPEVSFTGGGHSCNMPEVDPLVAHFEGDPPFTMIYLVNNNPDTLTTSEYSYTFNFPYDFQLITRQISDLNCTHEFIDTAYVQSGNIPTPHITGDNPVCAGSTNIYTTNTGIYSGEWSIPGITVFEIDSATNGSFITITWIDEGSYQIYLKLVNPGNGCESSETIMNVSVFNSPVAPEETDTSACFSPGENLSVHIETGPDDFIYWPSLNSTGNTITIEEEGDYPYILANSHGCSDTSALYVTSSCLPEMYVPEAFTPNGDGINDFLVVFGVYQNLNFFVYSPSGLLLYRSENEEVMWDGTVSGKQVPDGSYYWHAVYSNNNGDEQKLSGKITLIR